MAANNLQLDGRVALVTGASSGLGRHFAHLLASAGARVAAGARRREQLDSLVGEIRDSGGDALAVDLDVTSAADVASAFDRAQAAFGPVDIVVNNAGIGRAAPVEQTTEEDWQATIETNLTGVHRVAAEGARRLIAAGQPGSIINIASVLGIRVSAGVAAYNASKAAVIHLTRSQALEWARHGIRANALCPGYFPTEINAGFLDSPAGQAMLQRVPMRRAGRLQELDGIVLLLASDAASYMTGSVIAVDGGHLCGAL